MRLGDLDALKDEFLSKTHLTLFELLDLIDNAPSVEPFERIGAICNENCGYRPQGEWIRKEDVIHLLERWADGYSYIEIPTDTAIKAIKELEGGQADEN